MSLPEAILRCNPNLRFMVRANNKEGLLGFAREIRECIPFVGAGISKPFGFPLWPELIMDLSEKLGMSVDEQKDLETKIEKDIESAAQMVCDFAGGSYNFSQIGQSIFNRRVKQDEYAGKAVEMLPYIFKRHVFTTNYDTILEDVYASFHKIAFPVLTHKQPKDIHLAVFTHQIPVIIKLHGDFNTLNDNYIFTRDQYNKYYEDPEIKATFQKVLTNSPLIFLGASILGERYLEFWLNAVKNDHRIRHFAILSEKETEEEQNNYRKKFERKNIQVIWYPYKQHKYVRIILQFIAELLGELKPGLFVRPENEYIDRNDKNSVDEIIKTVYSEEMGQDINSLMKKVSYHFEPKFVYIHGLGGVGKTTLMNVIYHQMKNTLYRNNIKNVEVCAIKYHIDWDKTFKSAKINLENKDKKYICFVDNLVEGCKYDTLKNYENVQIYATSRISIDKISIRNANPYYTFYDIDLGWQFPEPFELFMNYFSSLSIWRTEAKESIDKIIGLAKGHTLTIELLAKHAYEKAASLDIKKGKKELENFYDELTASGFNMEKLYYLGENRQQKEFYSNVIEHLSKLVRADKLSESQTAILEQFSLLGDADFRPEEIGVEFFSEDMKRMEQLGWIKDFGNESYRMHDIIKKLVHDKENESRVQYKNVRSLVLHIGRALNKREIEKMALSVYDRMDYIYHAQSLFDYFNRVYPYSEEHSLDNYNPDVPVYDDAYIELVNNLFSSYDDIELREKAFEGSVLAEKLRYNYLIYSNYAYAVSANSVAYLFDHYEAEKNMEKSENYYLAANTSLDIIGKSVEKNILQGKITSNLGADCQARFKITKDEKDIEEALAYHKKSLQMREELLRKYPDDKAILGYIWTSTRNIASDYYWWGKIKKDVSRLIQAQKGHIDVYDRQVDTYETEFHGEVYNTAERIANTGLEILEQLNEAGKHEQMADYLNLSLRYLGKAVEIRKKLDGNEIKLQSLEEIRKKLNKYSAGAD